MSAALPDADPAQNKQRRSSCWPLLLGIRGRGKDRGGFLGPRVRTSRKEGVRQRVCGARQSCSVSCRPHVHSGPCGLCTTPTSDCHQCHRRPEEGASLPTSERAQVHGEVTWPHSLRSAPGPTHLGVRGPADPQVTWDRPCVSTWGLRGRSLRLGDPLPSPRGRTGMNRHCCKQPRR